MIQSIVLFFEFRGFGWRRHFVHVAEFAEFVALALNGTVVAEQRAEFAAIAAQVLFVHQHMVASQRHDGVNLGVVRIFGHALKQVLVQLQQFGPLVAQAVRRRQFAQVGADSHGAIRGREIQRHLIAPGLHLQHVGVKFKVVCDALAALRERRLEIKQRNADVNPFGQGQFAGDAVNGHAFVGQRNVCAEADDDVL